MRRHECLWRFVRDIGEERAKEVRRLTIQEQVKSYETHEMIPGLPEEISSESWLTSAFFGLVEYGLHR